MPEEEELKAYVPVILVFEDNLSKEVLNRLILFSGMRFFVARELSGRGYGYIKKNITGLNQAAKGNPFLVLTDLDTDECAPAKIKAWLPVPMHPNLLFRIAVREVEAWLLADHAGFSKFLGIAQGKIPDTPDDLSDPKRTLIDLARRSRKRTLREDIVPRPGSRAVQGPAYNECLGLFVREKWNPQRALENSPSLERTVRALRSFEPTWR